MLKSERFFILLIIYLISHGKALSVHSDLGKQSDPSVSYNLPTEWSDGTIITINGKLDVNSTLNMMLSSKCGKDHYCRVTFVPQKEVIAQSSKKAPYYLPQPVGESVTYSLQMDARTLDGEGIIDMYFESNRAGPHVLDRCEVVSLSDIDKIVIKGAQRVLNLKFEYQEPST